MLVKNRRGPPIHINPVCDIQNIALTVVLSNMHIVDTGVPLSRREANGVYAKIGVHLVKGWVLLEAIGITAFHAGVGDFLQKHHKQDLDKAVEEMSKCANTRIPIFSLLHALPE